MRLVPVPALHIRVEMAEADPQTFTEVLVKPNNSRKLPGSVKRFHSAGLARLTLLTMAKMGTPAGRQELSVLEVDGLRPGPSVVQVMTGNPREARQPIRVSKSVPVDPTDGQTVDVRGIAPTGVVSGTVKAEGNASVPPGVLVFLREESKGTAYRQDVDSAGNFTFFFR